MATQRISAYADENTDEAVLASLGYKQEFKREFSRIEIFGVGISVIGLVPSVSASLVFALPNGGPVAMVWGWLACTMFLMCIALSLAELASSAPTSGGLYYLTFKFSPPSWRHLMSWIVGCNEDANTIGNFTAVASIDWGCAVQIMAAISIGSGSTFVPTVGKTFGLCCALAISQAILCSLGTNIIARLQKPSIMLNVVLCFVIIIGVPAATPAEFRNAADFTLTHFENLLGWPNPFAFVLSFLYPLWCIGGFDSTLHLSEEATNARVAVPWAIVTSTAYGCLLGLVINIALAFCMGPDVEAIFGNPIQQPMAVILLQSFGRRGTLTVWSCIVIAQYMLGVDIMTAASRQTFAFARDGALPFSRSLYRVNARFGTPLNCVWFTTCFALLLCLLAFAGPTAIAAVFSLAVACQYVVYTIPIAARFLGGNTFQKGPFTLGQFGFPVAMIAVLWMIFNTIIFMFPTSPNPTPPMMNYAVVVLFGTIFVAVLYYYIPIYGGRHWFKGPISNVLSADALLANGANMMVAKETGSQEDALAKTYCTAP